MNLPFQTPGYEKLELSTQILIAEALNRGIKVEIIDAIDNFIRLSKGRHVELVEKATMTSRDSYITSKVLGNKLVTHKILTEKGIRTPRYKNYSKAADAISDYTKYKKQKIVIKPKTSNYGIGIHILPQYHTEKDFQTAIKETFRHDQEILVEQFIEGLEYRFLVIGSRVIAVIQRIPANVIGDGDSNISQLIAIKNKDPNRGHGYKTPLEKINIGSIEKEILKTQRLTPKSIPKKGKQIFLRKNSNISTGGDSIDATNYVHKSYKQLAAKTTKAVGAAICGVDIIIKNGKRPATSSNYAILEVNYNPVLYFHDFPYLGKGHKTAKYVLDLLGY